MLDHNKNIIVALEKTEFFNYSMKYIHYSLVSSKYTLYICECTRIGGYVYSKYPNDIIYTLYPKVW